MSSIPAARPLALPSGTQTAQWTGRLARAFRRVAMLAVRGTEAEVTALSGIGEAALGISISLLEATPLRWTLEAASPIVGAGRGPGGDCIARALGLTTPRAYAVIPIVSGGRVASLAYVDCGDGAFALDEVTRVFAFCHEVMAEQEGQHRERPGRASSAGLRGRTPRRATASAQRRLGAPRLERSPEATSESQSQAITQAPAPAAPPVAVAPSIEAALAIETEATKPPAMARLCDADASVFAELVQASFATLASLPPQPLAQPQPPAPPRSGLPATAGATTSMIAAAPPRAPRRAPAPSLTASPAPSPASSPAPSLTSSPAPSPAASPAPSLTASPAPSLTASPATPTAAPAAAPPPPPPPPPLPHPQSQLQPQSSWPPPRPSGARLDAAQPCEVSARSAALATSGRLLRPVTPALPAPAYEVELPPRAGGSTENGAIVVVTPAGVVTLAGAPSRKPSRTMIASMAVGTLLCVALSTLAPPDIHATDTRRFTVPQHASLGAVAAQLEAQGLVRNDVVFVSLARLMGRDRALQAGSYSLNPGAWPWQILGALTGGQVAMAQVTIPEGLTLRETADLLHRFDVTNRDDFLAAALDTELLASLGVPGDSAEGYLFPETYTFARGTSGRKVLETMVQVFFARLRQLPEGAAATQEEIRDRVILASIIEKEAADDSELGRISGVFANRLERHMKLESCATVQYVLEQPKEKLTLADVRRPSPYNTYLNYGLPPGPIASPGQGALRAAFRPEPHDLLFFFAKHDGSHQHVFTRTYAEHMNAQRMLSRR